MSSPSHEPVVSGRHYAVVDVAGAAPTSLDDFAGDTAFTVGTGELTYLVRGQGLRREGDVAFYEKAQGSGKDLRVWRVVEGADGGFEAVHDARF